MNRKQMLAGLDDTRQWDVVIIGGGATGLGCAVDAASRGYATLLVEQSDFAKGTSGRSTKLVHGGVRYLAQGNLKLVREALRERAYLLHNAPGITATSRFVVPVFSWQSQWFYGIGLKLYDLLAGKLSLHPTRWLNKTETLHYLPGINQKNVAGGILYYDGQFDDARLAIALAATAIKQNATVLNYAKAEALLKNNGLVSGIVMRDVLTDKTYIIQSKIVINATGVYADAVMQMDAAANEKMISPSQGAHIVVDAAFFPGEAAMMIPKTDDGRVLFAVPWHRKVIIGTTDTPVADALLEPKPLPEEIDFIIQHANRYLTKTITKKDVLSTFAGLRPLIKQKGISVTSALSRDHAIVLSPSGLLTVSGGKWTTYRKIAEEVIDTAAKTAHLPFKKSITQTVRIGGAEQIFETNTTPFLQSGFSLSEKDIAYFVRQEMAMTIEDVLARRTRLLFLDAREAIKAAPFVAKCMAALLGKNDNWITKQVQEFTELAKGYILM